MLRHTQKWSLMHHHSQTHCTNDEIVDDKTMDDHILIDQPVGAQAIEIFRFTQTDNGLETLICGHCAPYNDDLDSFVTSFST